MGGCDRMALHLHSDEHLAADSVNSVMAVTRAALATAILLAAVTGCFFVGALGAFCEDTGEDW